MPRQPRLDAPEGLRHVRVRGIARTSLFRDAQARADFLARRAAQGALSLYGWAFLWIGRLGDPGRPLAAHLGVHPAVVYQAARRGAATAARPDRLLAARRKLT